MDDNRTQATSAYRSGYKHKSGCEHKRDSSFLAFGISPSKIISDMATGIRLFPGAAAHHKKNKKDRGGDRKIKELPPSRPDRPIHNFNPFADDDAYRLSGGFTGSFSSAPPCLFNIEFEKSCFEEVHIR